MMAFKKGVTVYFTDEGKYEEFLKNHEISGKTKSKFVLDHLNHKNENHKAVNATSWLMGGFYSSYPLIDCYDASFSLLSDMPLGLFGESKLKKQLLKSVDEYIRKDFSERLSKGERDYFGGCYHLIKTKITLMYARNKIDGVECISGTCLCRYGVVTINEPLWRKYDGLYDFTKINYQKYINIFMSPKKNKQLALVLEPALPDDMVGGFFISVYPEGKSYPRDFSECGFQEYPELPYAKVKISGVSEHQNINRIAYKELSRIDGGAVHMAKKTKIK